MARLIQGGGRTRGNKAPRVRLLPMATTKRSDKNIMAKRTGKVPAALPHQRITRSQKHGRFDKFFELPPELRNRIYKLAIPQGKEYVTNYYHGKRDRYTRPPALAHSCRQFRQEVLPLWRSGNRFLILAAEYNVDSLFTEWLLTAGKDALQHVHLIITVRGIEARGCTIPGSSRRCTYDMEVELKNKQYEMRLTWHVEGEGFTAKSAALQEALVYGKAKGWMIGMEAFVEMKFAESDMGLQVRHDLHEDGGDTEDDE